MEKVGQIYKNTFGDLYKIVQVDDKIIHYAARQRGTSSYVERENYVLSAGYFDKVNKHLFELIEDVKEEIIIPQPYISRLSKIE